MEQVLCLDNCGIRFLDVSHDGHLVPHLVRKALWAVNIRLMYLGDILFAHLLAGVASYCRAIVTATPRDWRWVGTLIETI